MTSQSRAPRWLVAVVVLASSSGCAIASNPDAIAYSQVSNECSSPVAVGVGQFASDFPSDGKTSLVLVLAPGESHLNASPLYLPLGDSLYVWAVDPGAPRLGDPQAILVDSLESHVASDGTTTYLVVVSGALCPS